MATQKHLTPEQRSVIKEMIEKDCSFTEIGRRLDKDPSTISKEVRNHLVFMRVGYRYINYNACTHRFSCEKVHVCSGCKPDKRKKLSQRCTKPFLKTQEDVQIRDRIRDKM